MREAIPDPAPAFGRMQRALVRRRFARIELRLRLEIAFLAALVWGFLFWQARIAFAVRAHDGGPQAVALALLVVWVVLAAAGAVLAASRLWRQLTRGPAGPAWLALPLPPSVVLRHLAWEARLRAQWGVALAPPFLVAAIGLVPSWWLPLLAGALPWMVLEGARLACALTWRLALHGVPPRAADSPLARLLATAARRARRVVRRRARWTRPGVRGALLRKDVLLAWRMPAARRRLVLACGAGALSVLVWLLPLEPPLARLAAFTLALYAAAAWGEFLITLAGEDPFALLRALPVRVGAMWTVRAMLAAGGALALTAAQFVLARRVLPAQPLHLFLGWTGLAALAVGVLAVNYGLTLFPRSATAHRMYALSLGLAMAASLMIPLSGWIVLATAVVHSARRLPRWALLEDTA